MQELMNAFRELHIVLIGLGLMLGVISLKQAGKSLLWMLLWPILFVIGWSFWQQLPPGFQMTALAAGAVAVPLYLLFGTSFGRNVLASIVAPLVRKITGCLLKLFLLAALGAGLLIAFGLL